MIVVVVRAVAMTRRGKDIVKVADTIDRFDRVDLLFADVVGKGFFNNRIKQIRRINAMTQKAVHTQRR